MDYTGYPVGLLVGKPGNFHPLFRSKEALMDNNIRILGLFQEPLIGGAVAAEDKAQTVPVKTVAHRTIANMNGRERSDLDAVFIVDDRSFRKIEFMSDDLATSIR